MHEHPQHQAPTEDAAAHSAHAETASSGHGHDDHDGHPGGHDRHAGHSVAMFRDKFWLTLISPLSP